MVSLGNTSQSVITVKIELIMIFQKTILNEIGLQSCNNFSGNFLETDEI